MWTSFFVCRRLIISSKCEMPYTVFLKNYVKLSERNIYFIEFFFSPNSANISKSVKLRKMQNFGVFCNFANFELFALLGFTSTKKCVNSLSSSKNTRKMTVIKTLMARLAYTRIIFCSPREKNWVWEIDTCLKFNQSF